MNGDDGHAVNSVRLTDERLDDVGGVTDRCGAYKAHVLAALRVELFVAAARARDA